MKPVAVLTAAALMAAACSGGSSQGPPEASPIVSTTATVATTLPPGPNPTAPNSSGLSPMTTNIGPVPDPPSAPAETSTTAASTSSTLPPLPVVPPTAAELADLKLRVERVVDLEGVDGMAWRPGDPGLYLIGQLGQVWRMVDGAIEEPPILDLRDRTSVLGLGSSETGLLGIAFDPRDGRMFLNFTNLDGDNTIASWVVENGAVVPGSERRVMVIDQPGPGHNGGGMQFDPRGDLFVGVGDGGASNGADARDLTNLLGSIVRIRPRTDAPGYEVPPDNPFLGDDDVADEIFAYGMRNPWRLYLDPGNGDLWFSDVGNGTTEEINLIPAGTSGQDFGWNLFEGSRRIRRGEIDMTPAVYEYGRDRGVASIGGVRYRGTDIPALRGAMVFGDLLGRLILLGSEGAAVHVRLDIGTLVSVADGPDGEIYLLSIFGGVYRLAAE